MLPEIQLKYLPLNPHKTQAFTKELGVPEKRGENYPKESKKESRVWVNSKKVTGSKVGNDVTGGPPNRDIGGGPPDRDFEGAAGKKTIFLANPEINEPKSCEARVSLIDHCAAAGKLNIESPIWSNNSCTQEESWTMQWTAFMREINYTCVMCMTI